MDKFKLTTTITLLAMALLSLMASPARVLVHYSTRSLGDAMFPPHDLVDPFKIHEHSPLSISQDDTTVALAQADWRETPTAHEIWVDVPGMKRDEVKVEVEERVLRVTGERKSEEEVKDEKWHRVERTVGKFWRQFRLPGNADVENVRAHLDDGVLRITVPKLAEGDKKRPEAKVISLMLLMIRRRKLFLGIMLSRLQGLTNRSCRSP